MFLKSKPLLIVTSFLLLQAAAFYGLSRSETTPVSTPLKEFPKTLGDWRLIQENVVEQEVRDVLKADDLLNVTYAKPGVPLPAYLFIAFFRSQRTGQAPHSPKNCLPGSGWVQSVSDELSIDVPGAAVPIVVNRYIVAKGNQQSVAIYWYQSRDRVVASEYKAKMFVVADALRYNRTDTSLVRVVVPVLNGQADAATDIGREFVRALYPTLKQYLPQ
jgi:EpsI family protein